MEAGLEQILNLLLESERAGVVALDQLIGAVENDDLRRLLAISREDEAATASALEQLIRANGGQPSDKIGPFAAKVAAAGALADQLRLLIRGEEWVARKVEEALALAPPDGPIADELRRIAKRHRFEVEWGRAELIRIMNAL